MFLGKYGNIYNYKSNTVYLRFLIVAILFSYILNCKSNITYLRYIFKSDIFIL